MTTIIRLITAAILVLNFVNGNVSWIQCHSSADDPLCALHSVSPSNQTICIHFYYTDFYPDGYVAKSEDYGCYYKSSCGTTENNEIYDPNTGAYVCTESIYADCGFVRNGGWWVFVVFPLFFGVIAIASILSIILIRKKENKKKSQRWGNTKENNPLPLCKAAWVRITQL